MLEGPGSFLKMMHPYTSSTRVNNPKKLDPMPEDLAFDHQKIAPLGQGSGQGIGFRV